MIIVVTPINLLRKQIEEQLNETVGLSCVADGLKVKSYGPYYLLYYINTSNQFNNYYILVDRRALEE
jgi:hypothetical protein